MKIENLRIQEREGRVRASASIVWEDIARAPYDLYFETESRHKEGFWCNPDAFLIGACMPAFYHGEKRIKVEEEVSPEIVEGIGGAMGWLASWSPGGRRSIPGIEADRKVNGFESGKAARAGLFFSGGVDSLSLLRSNRLTYSPDHPWYLKEGIIVFGLEVQEQAKFDHVLETIAPVAVDAGLKLVPVFTNLRLLEDDWLFWEHYFHDAVFCAIAHSFSKRYTTVTISATYDIPNIRPYGSHPLLTSCYSANALQMRHDGVTASRLDKMRQIAGWDAALQNLRVCNQSDQYQAGKLNCGRCIKCIRTMLELEAAGALQRCCVFGIDRLSVDVVEESLTIYRTTVSFFETLVEPLSRAGRGDLSRAVQKKLNAYYRQEMREQLKQSVLQTVKNFDRAYLGNRLRQVKQGFRK